jgi:hypothetical protein
MAYEYIKNENPVYQYNSKCLYDAERGFKFEECGGGIRPEPPLFYNRSIYLLTGPNDLFVPVEVWKQWKDYDNQDNIVYNDWTIVEFGNTFNVASYVKGQLRPKYNLTADMPEFETYFNLICEALINESDIHRSGNYTRIRQIKYLCPKTQKEIIFNNPDYRKPFDIEKELNSRVNLFLKGE